MVDALLEREFRATRLQSSGGFLKKTNATILVGVDESAVDDVIAVIRANCKSRTLAVDPVPPSGESGGFRIRPAKVDVRAAIVFVVPIDGFERA